MPESDVAGLVFDWGGVLTGDLGPSVSDWASGEGIPLDAWTSVMRDWLGEPAGLEARFNPIHALERGEVEVAEFEVRLAEALSERTGREIAAFGLLGRMFARFENAHEMSALIRRARLAGLRTALLSNSWGNDYPRDGWDEMFDVVIISGEVGLRKPDPAIYELTLGRLGLPASRCVFVDDLAHNVAAAVGVGMIGIHHRDYDTTGSELEALTGLALR